MSRWQAVVFDLDDTLFPERDYVRGGFRRVAEAAAEIAGEAPGELFAFLWGAFEQGIRGDTFDRLLQAYPRVARRCSAPDLVTIYRSHEPRIELLPGMAEALADLQRQGVRLGLISDGPLASQEAKVRALDLPALFHPLLLTDRWGPEFWKPHPRSFQVLMDTWGLPPGDLVFIADNPAKDFLTPRRMGWQTIRLRLNEQLRYGAEPPSAGHAADINFSSVSSLLAYLKADL